MEEKEFKTLYAEVNELPCVFQKAILSARCSCSHAQKLNIAEREAVACQNADARINCEAVYQAFIEKARFALHKLNDAPLTHAESIKVQVGGVSGLQEVLGDQAEVPRIGDLIMKAYLQYPDLQDLPVDEIVRSIVHCKVRQRKAR
ncbi:MAG: hypothetical protein R3240_03250 [Gammaproteobacteria bacterium]|nr:hypothetical protein [Gammaproteobacteria bacterium]